MRVLEGLSQKQKIFVFLFKMKGEYITIAKLIGAKPIGRGFVVEINYKAGTRISELLRETLKNNESIIVKRLKEDKRTYEYALSDKVSLGYIRNNPDGLGFIKNLKKTLKELNLKLTDNGIERAKEHLQLHTKRKR